MYICVHVRGNLKAVNYTDDKLERENEWERLKLYEKILRVKERGSNLIRKAFN